MGIHFFGFVTCRITDKKKELTMLNEEEFSGSNSSELSQERIEFLTKIISKQESKKKWFIASSMLVLLTATFFLSAFFVPGCSGKSKQEKRMCFIATKFSGGAYMNEPGGKIIIAYRYQILEVVKPGTFIMREVFCKKELSVGVVVYFTGNQFVDDLEKVERSQETLELKRRAVDEVLRRVQLPASM